MHKFHAVVRWWTREKGRGGEISAQRKQGKELRIGFLKSRDVCISRDEIADTEENR